MIDAIRRVSKHPFVRGAALFQLGSVGAMIVQAGAGVVVARLLGPAEFGRFALAMSMAAVASVLLGTGVADAMAPVLTRAHHGGDERGVRDAILFIGKFVLASAAVVLLLGLTMPQIASWLYNDSMLGWYGLAVLAASALSTLLFVPVQLGLQVAGRITSLSILTFIDQCVRQAWVVELVFLGAGVLGGSYGHLFGAVVVLGIASWFWRTLRRSWGAIPSLRSLWQEFPQNGTQYIAPTLWVLADRNLAMLYSAAPIAIAGLFLATTDVSYFKIALGWVTLALSVQGPISTLLNTELARVQAVEPQRLRAQFIRVTLWSLALSTTVTLVAAAIARPVFSLLYGAQYGAAVPFVYGLIPMGVLFGLGVALGPMWRAMNRVKVSIGINVLVLMLGIPSGAWALHTWGIAGAVGMVTAWYTVSHGASFIYLLYKLRSAPASATIVGL
jgi:O-antigen/teichoic acid export membrane protein